MKLSVGKTTAIWIKIGLSVAFYILCIISLSLESYVLFLPLAISFILLGWSLPDFQYLREKPRRLALTYVFLCWLILLYLQVFLEMLQEKSYGFDTVFYGLFSTSIISILVYFLISKRVKPVPIERKEHLEEAQNNIAKVEFSNNLSAVDLENPTSHLKLSTPLKITFSLLLFVNILALMALPFKQYVSLAFVVPVAIAVVILPLSKYLRGEPGRLPFAYIVLLNISWLMIWPATAIGFTFDYEDTILFSPLLYSPVALFAVSFLIYLANKVNVAPIVKGILRKMYYERENRINAFNQLSETEARKYKSRLYLTIFVSLTILNVIALVISKFSNALSLDEELPVFIISGISYAILAVFTLKRFLPKAKLYPLMIYHCSLLIAAIPVYRDPEGVSLISLNFALIYLAFIGLAFVAYEIYQNITKSKFAWRDAAVKVGTKK